jgi:hypothetical protein
LLQSAVSLKTKLDPAFLLSKVSEGTKLDPKMRKQMLDNTIALYNARAKYGNDILNKKYLPKAKNY